MRRLITVSTLALLLIYGCIQGALWQFDRYQIRHSYNDVIRSNVAITSSISESELKNREGSEIAWREISINGSFDSSKEFLIRNRYHEGKYGFGVITLFKSESGKSYWVDRGWVIAGRDAQTPPIVQKVSDELLEINARVRLQDIESQVRGSVFALPSGDGASRLTKWNSEQEIETEAVYFDLISTSNPLLTPEVPTPLPELSDGPHLAYSFQWVLFIFLVALAWFLVLREDRSTQPVKL